MLRLPLLWLLVLGLLVGFYSALLGPFAFCLSLFIGPSPPGWEPVKILPFSYLPDRRRTGGRSCASHEPTTQTSGCKSACPMASCCRSPPRTTPECNLLELTTPGLVTLCETGRIQRMLPLEWMWAFVLALLGSAARIPWSRSCLLYKDMVLDG